MALPVLAGIAVEAGIGCALNKACRSGSIKAVKSAVNSVSKFFTGKKLFTSEIKNSMIKKGDNVIEAEIISASKNSKNSLFNRYDALSVGLSLADSLANEYANSQVEKKFDDTLDRAINNTIQSNDYKSYAPNSIPNPYKDIQNSFIAKQYKITETKSNQGSLLDVIEKQTKEFNKRFEDMKTSHEDAIVALTITQGQYLERIANMKFDVKSPDVINNINSSLKIDKPVDVNLPSQFMDNQNELLKIKKDKHKFETTDISIKDLEGNEVIKTSPRLAKLMSSASVLQYMSDENNFDLDSDDLEYKFGDIPNFLKIFKTSSLDFISEVKKD